MWAPGSTGQLNLFIGDRAHIPMYIALSRHSCSQAQHSAGVSDNSTRWYKHSSTQRIERPHSPAVAVPSHFRQVAQTDGTQGAQYRVEFTNATQSMAPTERWWRETLCSIVRSNRHHGGINQLLAEQIRAPGSRGVLASQAGAQDSTSR